MFCAGPSSGTSSPKLRLIASSTPLSIFSPTVGRSSPSSSSVSLIGHELRPSPHLLPSLIQIRFFCRRLCVSVERNNDKKCWNGSKPKLSRFHWNLEIWPPNCGILVYFTFYFGPLNFFFVTHQSSMSCLPYLLRRRLWRIFWCQFSLIGSEALTVANGSPSRLQPPRLEIYIHPGIIDINTIDGCANHHLSTSPPPNERSCDICFELNLRAGEADFFGPMVWLTNRMAGKRGGPQAFA